MEKLTIAQALKRKNKLIKEIDEEFRRVMQNNSSQKGEEKNYSSRESLERAENKTQELIDLKVAIQKANTPVADKIYKLSELKSEIQYLRRVYVRQGTEIVFRRGGEAEVEFEAEIGQVELDDMISKKEEEIDQIQEELDQFNHTTYIN